MMAVVYIIIAAVNSYLLGSISFGVIFSKLFAKKDVREYGSGSAGMTNVLRSIGVLPGVLTFICDALKGFVSCLVAKQYFFPMAETLSEGAWWTEPIYGAYLCGLICMIGHMFPLFFGFRGGKGVAISVGIFAVCCPLAIVSGLVAFAVSVFFCRIVSLSSLIATVTVGIGVVIWHSPEHNMWIQIVLTVAMCALVFWKHKENIVRLAKGEEKRLAVKKEK